MRRIEAVTGRAAEDLVRLRFTLVEEIARRVGASPQDLSARVAGVLESLDEERRRSQQLQREAIRRNVDDLASSVLQVDGLQVLSERVEAGDFETLREMADLLRQKMGSGVVVLGAVFGGRPNFLAAVTKDLAGQRVNSGSLVREVAAVTGGSGGGRPELAQAGGRDASKLDEALRKVPSLLQGG